MFVSGSSGFSARTAADSARIARVLAAFEVRVQMVWGFHHPVLFARDEGHVPNDIVKAFKDFAVEIGVRFFSPSRRIGFPADVLTRDNVTWFSRDDFARELYQELANEGVTWDLVDNLAYRLALGPVYEWDEYKGKACADDCSYCYGGDPIPSRAATRNWQEGEIRRQAGQEQRENLLSKRERIDLGRVQAHLSTLRRRKRKGRTRREYDDLEF